MSCLEEMIRSILRSKDTVGRYDLLSVFSDPLLFKQIVKELSAPFYGLVDHVVSPEAIGWVLGSAVAAELGASFIGARKSGKLPYAQSQLFSSVYVDYSKKEKSLELPKTAIKEESRVLVVDEWIETGATVHCCLSLLDNFNCRVIGIASVGIDPNEGTRAWIDSGFVKFIGMDL